jgi:hypothetical protein
MILSFKTKWGKDMPPHIAGKPTHFPEKIITGLDLPDYRKDTLFDLLSEILDPEGKQFDQGLANPFFPHHPKLHTIREDKNNRWRVGMSIQYYINARQPNMHSFAPNGIVKSIQEIEIKHWREEEYYPVVEIEGKRHYAYEKEGYEAIEQLALNDGFDSVDDFLDYFNQDFKGKLIHWTDLKY